MLQILDFFAAVGPWSWLAALIGSAILTVICKIALKIVSSRIRALALQTETPWDDITADIIDGLKTIVLFSWILYLCALFIPVMINMHKVLHLAVVVLSSYQLMVWGLYLIKNWRDVTLKKRVESDLSSASALNLIYFSTRFAFITIIILVAMSSMGINIGALLAGLGVGGIAVALAAQNILGDLLASLSIVLDKPFVTGDFIIVGTDMGTVEQIGIKTTRVRSLSGEQLIFSNKDLLESRIRNYKRMWERRIVQRFSVALSTPPEVLEQIPQWVRGFIEKHDRLRYDRCHFAAYGQYALEFELVFWVKDPNYNVYMDLQEKLLLDIKRKFIEEKVALAVPVQTVYLQNPSV